MRLPAACRVSTRGGTMAVAYLLVSIAFEERLFVKLVAPAFAYYGLRRACSALVETSHALADLLSRQVHSNITAGRSASVDALSHAHGESRRTIYWLRSSLPKIPSSTNASAQHEQPPGWDISGAALSQRLSFNTSHQSHEPASTSSPLPPRPSSCCARTSQPPACPLPWRTPGYPPLARLDCRALSSFLFAAVVTVEPGRVGSRCLLVPGGGAAWALH